MNTDLIHILGNLANSFLELQKLFSGAGYVLGIIFVITGLVKFEKVNRNGRERMAVPVFYIVGGAALIFLPSTMDTLSETVFGSGSVLQYAPKYNIYDINTSIRMLITTIGVICFVRGSVLLVDAAEPGEQHGIKGLLLIISAVFSMNFDATVSMLNTGMTYLMQHFSSMG